jgi:hypothetical protein
LAQEPDQDLFIFPAQADADFFLGENAIMFFL